MALVDECAAYYAEALKRSDFLGILCWIFERFLAERRETIAAWEREKKPLTDDVLADIMEELDAKWRELAVKVPFVQSNGFERLAKMTTPFLHIQWMRGRARKMATATKEQFHAS